jgi:anti-anti-sigma factor
VAGGVARAFSCDVVAGVGRMTLLLRGELDILGAAEARRELLGLTPPRGGWLVIDLRDLSFMDSTGVRLILQTLESAERYGAALALIRGPTPVQRVLEIVGLAEQLLILDEPSSTSQIKEEA